jgi:hypothetical protein
MPIPYLRKNLKLRYNMTNDPEHNDDIRDALRSYGLKQEIKRIHDEIMPSLKGKRPVRSLFIYANRIAAAILILIVSAGIVIYFTSTPSNLFNSRYEPYEESAQRGNAPLASAIETKFLEGQKMLQEGNAVNAINIFSDLMESNKRSNNNILADDTEYYLALAYLKADQPGNALRIFRSIYYNKGHLYNDKVTQWFLLRLKIASLKEK